jgi:transposase
MRYELADKEWVAIKPMLPNKPRGVPRVNDRRVLNGIFWVLRSGAPWRDLPQEFGPYTTCYNRFVRWRRAGVWAKIMSALAGAHDAAVQMIDTSIVRVHQHGACITRNRRQSMGRSRGGLTSKIHAVVDTNGLPVRLALTAGEAHEARTFTNELLPLAPDVIVAHGTPALTALHRATRTIPVVFVSVIDPVGAGYVQSLALPGGNITGFSTFEPEIGGKWLELLKEIAPGLRRVAGIFDPGFRGFAGVWGAIENMAPRFGLQVTSLIFHEPADDLEAAVANFGQQPAGGSSCCRQLSTRYSGIEFFLWLPATAFPPSMPFDFTRPMAV